MKRNKQILSIIPLTLFLAVLILDSKTALQGAQEGIKLCVLVVVPSLFPFIFLAGMLPSRLLGSRVPVVRKLGKICGLPDGSESLLLLGFLGGYPLGAYMVAQAYSEGCISRSAASNSLA